MNNSPSKTYDQFLSQFPLRRYSKGRVLISPDEEPAYIFFIAAGKVRKYDITKYGDQVVMNVFTAPTLLPLSWALNKTPNQYYYEAVTPLVVRYIPIKELTSYLKSDPDTAYSLLQQVYSGLENTQRRVVYLTRGNARSRLLFELLIEAQRSGEKQSDGSVIINISETELAERAGLSRETISRELAKVFKHVDVCKRQGRSIVIQDLDKIDEMLQKTA